MKVLLDTDAYSHLKRGHRRVAELVRRSQEIYFSAVVAGELLYGFRHGSRFEKNWHELQEFVVHPFVRFLPVTLVTSDRYSRIALGLRRKGKPIPSNDIWVAAHCMESGAELLSFDDHFGHIDGLAWTDLSSSR